MRTTTFDLTPFHRSVIGFERLARALESAPNGDPGYPPYNIERLDEDSYRVTMAVAGFTTDDIDVTVHDGVLIIAGKQADADECGHQHAPERREARAHPAIEAQHAVEQSQAHRAAARAGTVPRAHAGTGTCSSTRSTTAPAPSPEKRASLASTRRCASAGTASSCT